MDAFLQRLDGGEYLVAECVVAVSVEAKFLKGARGCRQRLSLILQGKPLPGLPPVTCQSLAEQSEGRLPDRLLFGS